MLLTLHPKVGIWLQMGGHCEPGDPDLAARRAARGHRGVRHPGPHPAHGRRRAHPGDARPPPGPLHRQGPPENTHLDVQYVALARPGAEALISEESLDLRWFGYDSLPELTDDSVRALVARARELTR
ncbi:NUDIX hydrolase [Streptomyces lusitanus]|uniref:NUDIX hydrolase n=1 Tax=Streptomyces lusitanus TaxID=68232 RepID=UPI0036271B1E